MENVFTVNSKFKEGDDVIELDGQRRRGTITKVWDRVINIGTRKYKAVVSYTVTPNIPSYNRFRVKEEEIRKIEVDDKGIAF